MRISKYVFSSSSSVSENDLTLESLSFDFPPSVSLIDVYIDVFCYRLKNFGGEIETS